MGGAVDVGGAAVRYRLVDAVRGLAIVNMVAFHFLYDVFVVYGREPGWYGLAPVRIWQQAICWTFILVSGFVWRWGRSGNLRRGLTLNVWGLVVTAVTLWAVPDEAVWFGILTFIGCAVLALIPLSRVLDRFPAAWGLACAVVLFVVFRHVEDGYLWAGVRIPLPVWLYECRVLTPLGFPFSGFRSGDYFPVLPWLFLYVCGYCAGRLFEACPMLHGPATRGLPVLSAAGRHSMGIYLIHQPVCMAVCLALDALGAW